VTDPQAAHDSGVATEQVAPAGVTDREDSSSQARSPESEQDVENEPTGARVEPGTPLTASDPRAAHDGGMVAEHTASADVTDHEDSWSQASSPEPERYAGNGIAEPPAESGPRTASLGAEELASVRARWREIQGHFVDEPRSAVQDADALVADLMQRLARMFAAERDQLESGWTSHTDVSTEDLRQGLQRYRSFLERLLAACASADPPPSTGV
jgi:hypothetical protein